MWDWEIFRFSHFLSNSHISPCRTKTSNSTWTTVGTSWACTMWRWGESLCHCEVFPETCLWLCVHLRVGLSTWSRVKKKYSHLNSSSRAYRSRFSSSRYYEACHIVTRGKFSTGTWNPRTSSSTTEENSSWLISVRGARMEFSVQGRIKDKERFLLLMWGEKKKINKKAVLFMQM